MCIHVYIRRQMYLHGWYGEFGDILGSRWVHVGITLGSMLDQCGIIWDYVGLMLGSIRNQIWDRVGIMVR